ncbi:helix-turn-helix domain-containing protein [Senegalia sp. (in: firmicutes)]|uniref:helix-turn-helix domain-containing protein n=1 Tax=Senegalia sp. (in: firmicutes) TaxID=1924098 RepID=UPI003F9B649B
MTDYERQEIYKLRKEGLGYKAIGTMLGLTRDTVRSFCRRNNLGGNGKIVSLNIEVMKDKKLLCLNCGKFMKVKNKGRPRKYCSDKCRRTWWKENQDKTVQREASTYKHTCLYCGEEFSVYGNKKRKFCSHDCYIKYRFWSEENEI